MFIINILLISSILVPNYTTPTISKNQQPAQSAVYDRSDSYSQSVLDNNFSYFANVSKPLMDSIANEKARIQQQEELARLEALRIAEEKRLAEEKAAKERIRVANQQKAAALARQKAQAEAKAKAAQAAQTVQSTPAPSTNPSGSFPDYIIAMCAKYGCNAQILTKVMYCESGGVNKASKSGRYIGILQFSTSTFYANARRLGIANADVWNPYQQIEIAANMFARGQGPQAWPACYRVATR